MTEFANVTSPSGERPLALSDRSVRLLLLAVVVLQVIAWRMQAGYPIADAVEFMDRAHDWVLGGRLGGEQTIRSFAFSAFFVPLFGVARLLGLEDMRMLLPVARAMQLVAAVAFVFVTARLTSRLANRTAGLAALVVVGANPTVLLFSSWPISGITAALFVALGLERLIERTEFKRELVGALYLGAGFLMAYQTLTVILALGFALFLRDRFKHKSSWLALAAGTSIALAVQIALDRVVYGEWGGSVWRYLADNVGSTVTTWVLHLGFRDAARAIYQWQSDVRGFGFDPTSEGPSTKTLMPRTWYLVHILDMFAWPVLTLFAVGAWRAIRSRSQSIALLVLVFALNLLVLSYKGDKSFRLWLPLVPMLAPIAGIGFASLAGVAGDRLVGLRRTLAFGCVVGAVAMGPRLVETQNPRYHAVYWSAMEYVNHEVGAEPLAGGRKVKIAAAYAWAIFLRNGPNVELERFPYALDDYQKLTPAAKKEMLAVLDDLDGLIVHLPVLSSHPDLFAAVNERFRVHAAFYDQRVHAGLGPVFVLERQRSAGHAKHFFETEHIDDLESYREAHRLRHTNDFVYKKDDREEVISLLGFECEPIAGSDFQWITYHWFAKTDLSVDYRFVDRLTSPDNVNSWQNNHFPAYGVLPASKWKRGTILRESYLVVPTQDAMYADKPFLPMGGAYRRGDLIPARLWICVQDGDENLGPIKALEAREDGGTRPMRPTVPKETLWSTRGWRFSRGGLVQVGSLMLPVHESAKLPDDGKPVPN